MRTLGAFLLALLPLTAVAQTITTSSPLPTGAVNEAYSTQLTCINCKGDTWQLSGGSLPGGMTLDSTTGYVVGTPSVAGPYSFSVVLYTASGPTNATATFSLTINPALTISTTTIPNATQGVGYTVTLAASGGVGTYSWQLNSSSNDGMGLSSGGVLSGTPTATGQFPLAIVVYDSSQASSSRTITLTVVSGTPAAAITTTSLPNGVVNQPYSTQLACVNCSNYIWSISSGSLPTGLSLNPQNGAITGTPTVAGGSTFQVSLAPPTPSNSIPLVATANLSITIVAGNLAITQSNVPVGFQNTPYSTTLTGTGGTPPYVWSFQTSGTDGLTIGSSTGLISGTPTATGSFVLNVQITDSNNLQATRSFALTVAAALSILTSSLPNGTVNVAYPAQTLAAGGGQPPYNWSISTGTLPPGLTLNAAGTISGTPTASGAFPFTIALADAASNTAKATLSITVTGGLTITPATLPGGTAGTAYSQTMTVTGGTAPYTWSIASGALPAGLALGASTGVISGTPTTPGTSSFSLQAADSAGLIGQAALSIAIAAPPLTITTATLPNGTVSTAYTQTLAATGGVSPYTWSISAGSLPAGLTLNASSGAISGTPTTAATSSFTAQVTDSARTTATKALSIAIVAATPPLTVTAAALPNGTTGTAYSQTPLTVSGGVPPYKFALSSTSNDGLSINGSTGAISGTPTSAGSFTLTAVVTDSATPQGQATANLPLTVTSPPLPTLTVSGVPATSGFQQQIPATIGISSAYSSAISGTMTLTFAPSVTPSAGVDDLMIQFSSGSRVINFTIPAGSTTATLSGATSVTVLTGTTAGTITLTTVLTANGQQLGNPLVQTIVDAAGVPFISKVTLQQVPGGVNVVVTGFSSTRDMIDGQFAFTPATNDAFTADDVSVALTSAFTTWYSNTSVANAYGTQFTVTVPFTTDVGSNSFGAVSIVAVTVTLENSKGASSPVSLSQ